MKYEYSENRTFIKILSLFLLLTVVAYGGMAFPQSVQAAQQTGLVKNGSTYSYYQDGKMVKNTWKTVNGARYYFQANGKAATLSCKISGTWYVFGTNAKLQKGTKARLVTLNKAKYYVSKSGKAISGTAVISGKFYAFGVRGRQNVTRTNKLRAEAKYEKNFASLKKLIGKPKKSQYIADSCYGPGDDGILTYNGYKVYTYRENGKEIYLGAEGNASLAAKEAALRPASNDAGLKLTAASAVSEVQPALAVSEVQPAPAVSEAQPESAISEAQLQLAANEVQLSPLATMTLKQRVKKVVDKQVKASDTKKQKLKKLFAYAEKTYGYARVTGFKNTKGWEKTYAKQMLTKKKGSCYHYAAVYAFLAKQATGYTVRIALGETNGFSGKWQPHAWTEIKIGSKWYICDTNLDKFAAKSSGKYYLKPKSGKTMKKTYKADKYVKI